MRRLTLILSDLYLPAESADHSAPYVLPDLDWLLRFASHREPISDWRSWLATEFGAADFAGLPPAHAAAAHFFARLDHAPDLAGRAWFATPVHLEARID